MAVITTIGRVITDGNGHAYLGAGGGDIRLQSKTATPTTSQQTISPDDGYDGLAQVVVNAVTAAIDSHIQAGNIKKDVSILGVTGTYEGSGGGKEAQANDNMYRVNASSLTNSNLSLTVAKTGTYTIRWFAYRTSTSGTSGTRLYIGTSPYSGASENTSFSVNSNGQTNKLTGVHLTAGQVVNIYARARSTSYYTFVMGLSIIEE